jgi:hypothetical protein
LRIEDERGNLEVAAGRDHWVEASLGLRERLESLLGSGRVLFQAAERR